MYILYLVLVLYIVPPLSGGSLKCKEDIGHDNCDHLPNDVRCGVASSYDEAPRILGGKNVWRNEYPWAACIKQSETVSSCFCGGVLISKSHVLTAAHCMNFTRFPRDFWVILGEHDVRTDPDCGKNTGKCSAPVQKYQAEKVIVHDQYKNYFDYDIALIKLNREVDVNRYVQPICLPFRGYTNTDNIHVMNIGWGQKINDKKHLVRYILQEAGFYTISQEDCEKMPNDNKPITDRHICVVTNEHGSIHQPTGGDSGGPLMAYKVTDTGYQKFFLIGLNSYTYNEPPHKGVYTRVTSYLTWIINNM